MRPLRSSISLSLFPLFLFACAGGGGGSCAGIEPMDAPFPEAERIANAAQLRLTDSGIEHLEKNANNLVDVFFSQGLDFAFTKQVVFTFAGVDITICDDNDCSVHIEVNSLDLIPTAPNRLVAEIGVTLESRDSKNGLPGKPKTWDGTCDVNVNTDRGSRMSVTLVADIALANDTQPARRGFTYIDVRSISVSETEGIENDDLSLSGGFLGSCGLGNIGFFKEFIVNQIKTQVTNIAGGAVNEFLCTKPSAGSCPDGTYNVDGTCRYANNADARCVPLLLGYQGQGNLGQALLSSFAPNAEGSVQFTVAAGGQAEAVNDGMSIYALGGMRSTDEAFEVSPRHHECVPQVPYTKPTIARAPIFQGNTIPASMNDAHIGVGIAESFLDHVGYALYDSGLFCLGAGTELSQQVSTGVLSFLISSVPRVTFPERTAALSAELRPQKPPTFEVGVGTEEDPLLTLNFEDLDVHLNAFSQGRYIRFMTLRGDLNIALAVSVSGSTVSLTIDELLVENAVVTNSEILSEDPVKLAETLQAILSGLGAQLASAIPSFDLPSIMGLEIEIPPDGIVGVTSGGEEFLALYGNLKIPGGSPLVMEADTEATIETMSFDEELLHDGAHLEVIAEGIGRPGADYEFSYRVDKGAWSPWTDQERILVRDPMLRLEARHDIEVRARYANVPNSEDGEPVMLSALIDKTPPWVNVARDEKGLRLEAHDFVSDEHKLRMRLSNDSHTTGWQRFSRRPEFELTNEAIVVEVQDEASNQSSVQVAATSFASTSSHGSARAGGCQASSTVGAGWLWSALIALLLFVKRRRLTAASQRLQAVVLLGVLAVFAIGCGCSEGPGNGTPTVDGGTDTSTPKGCNSCAAPEGASTMGSTCCQATNMCVLYDLSMLCEDGFTCQGADSVMLDENCIPTCVNCIPPPPLDQGHIGSYLDVVVGPSGDIVFSAYNAGIPPNLPFGDLVVGLYNPQDGTVSWETVDGLPTDGPKQYDPDGWRSGYGAPGDDVGRWTGITISGGLFYVAYHDATNGALKVASGAPGAFDLQVVDDEGIAGRYNSIVTRADGTLVVAYNQIAFESDGTVISRSRAAHSTTDSPTAAADWNILDIAEKTIDCRPWHCAGFAEAGVCLETGKCAVETTDCADACTSGKSCVSGSCQASLPDNYLEGYEQGVGLHNDLVLDGDGLALAYYDSVSGAVRLARYDEDWGSPLLIDGVGTRTDIGAHPSLAVDGDGAYHFAYFDVANHQLRYTIRNPTNQRELVDDGKKVGGVDNVDGRHWVGADPALVVMPNGDVRIAYQDQSTQRTLLATRPSGASNWAIETLDDEPHTGFFSRQLTTESGSTVFSWWRAGGPDNSSGIRVRPIP